MATPPLQDAKCDANVFDQYDYMIKLLSGYGLAGKITMQVLLFPFQNHGAPDLNPHCTCVW